MCVWNARRPEKASSIFQKIASERNPLEVISHAPHPSLSRRTQFDATENQESVHLAFDHGLDEQNKHAKKIAIHRVIVGAMTSP
jgi:hypothetical protein